MNQYSAPAARVLNTDAGAPPSRGGMRQATRAAGADSGMRVCRIGPGADKDGTRCTGRRRGEARNDRELGRTPEEGAGQAHRSAEAGAVGGQ